ncbi:hypothetical protein FIBSPDRAFT_810130 [Athelia psychrophila]|uniref:RING-type domain-containing protein n=1 Tax=Athelia psychrophila TaxID=1759441 RepID=A0A166XEP5_9AGAM|nr:hypothetical protein FIBSPDRAFT_810130 [Fibularhizoctonia sp. CBS 109695]
MAEDAALFELRRTMSTGDIPSSAAVPRPPRAHAPSRLRQHTAPTTTATAPAAGAMPTAQQPAPTVHDLPETEPYQSRFGRMMAFFGYGRRASKARRALVSLIWNFSWGFIQLVFIIALLTVSTHTEAKGGLHPGMNEWEACDRPLGVWDCLWVGRIFLTCGVSYWGWIRDRTARVTTADMEGGTGTNAVRPTPAAAPVLPPNSRNASRRSASEVTTPANNQAAVTLPHSHLYARLSLLSSLMTLTWFLTAHILVYTSINTCRKSSPHLWWLTFGVLGVMYLMVIEVFLLGFLVFIMAPLLFLFYNIILLCLGRHPVQNPHMIKPEIGKLPKSIVESIPLVVYIPPPPDEPEHIGSPKVPAAIYSNLMTYPPKPKTAVPKRRFAFLNRLKKNGKDESGKANSGKQAGKGKGADEGGEPLTWEDNWEAGEYPFVRLEGNRAACAICLMDFEEPTKRGGLPSTPEEEPTPAVADGPSQVVPVEEERIQEEDRDGNGPKLEDAGEGAQPLRLLACGHVFHKTCVDPWLVDVSGRCPVCQRPVEVPVARGKRRGRGRRDGDGQ